MENNLKRSQKDDEIMGIKVNSSSVSSVLTSVKSFMSDSVQSNGRGSKFYIVTPNPELVLMAQENKNLKDALNSADISIPDGVGLKIARPSLNIIKGRVFFMDLIRMAYKEHWSVFLLGGLGNEAILAAEKLQKEFPGLEITTHPGPKLNSSAEPHTVNDITTEKEAIDQINRIEPNLLFVAFGNPKQEIWIRKNLDRLKIGGAMAVGGTLRYIAGLSKLPPTWMEKIGLEWLWRLITEPERLGRAFRAVVVFPVKFFLQKLIH